MFNRCKLCVLSLIVLISGFVESFAADKVVAPVDATALPISSTNGKNVSTSNNPKTTPALVSPSKPQTVTTNNVSNSTNGGTAKNNDFDFNLKMKAKNTSPAQQQETNTSTSSSNDTDENVDKIPGDIQYKSSPIEHLGNNILSQIDDDLFTQMSEIEKSTTLLTLELKREKLRNEIEAQKAIRQKNKDDLEQQKAKKRLEEFERKKQIEAELLTAKQNLLNKEQLFEVLKQRKLLNAYMNQMLINQQEWLKEKEALYNQISNLEQEKKNLVKQFKQRIDKVLEASAKNIQVAEAAKGNFERVVKNLKARNEQLRKRVEADAKIIKNAKNMYIQSQSIEELKDRNIANQNIVETNSLAVNEAEDALDDTESEEAKAEKLSAKYAILGISGRAGAMALELIGTDGQPLTVKEGSSLPTGHIVKEIGSDYAKFTRDGLDDYLYIGRTIDGYTPLLVQASEKSKK